MMKKRSQSALEYLITYGWAILVVVLVISALAYLGVIDFSKFMPDTCISSLSVVPCMGKPVTSRTTNTIVFNLNNVIGYSLTLSNTSTIKPQTCTNVYFCLKNGSDCQLSRTVPHNMEFLVFANCSMNTKRYIGTFDFSYTNSISSLPESFNVKVSSKVK